MQPAFQGEEQRIERRQAYTERNDQQEADKACLGYCQKHSQCRLLAFLLRRKAVKADRSKGECRPCRLEQDIGISPIMSLHEHEEKDEYGSRKQRLEAMPLLFAPLQEEPQGSSEDAGDRCRCRRAADLLRIPAVYDIHLMIRKQTHANEQHRVENHRGTKAPIPVLHHLEKPSPHLLHAHFTTPPHLSSVRLFLFASDSVLSCQEAPSHRSKKRAFRREPLDKTLILC